MSRNLPAVPPVEPPGKTASGEDEARALMRDLSQRGAELARRLR
ncbi:hypothetical protein [Azospirillum sp. B506]|nr:hypothetical protein [Azospirillum sp. B506]